MVAGTLRTNTTCGWTQLIMQEVNIQLGHRAIDYLFVCVCTSVHVHVGAVVPQGTCGGQRASLEAGLRDETLVGRFGSRCLYLLCQLGIFSSEILPSHDVRLCQVTKTNKQTNQPAHLLSHLPSSWETPFSKSY